MALRLQQRTSSHNKYNNSPFIVGVNAGIRMHIKTATSYVKQQSEYNAIIIGYKIEDKPGRYLSACGCNVSDDV